jgi:chaperonin GroES
VISIAQARENKQILAQITKQFSPLDNRVVIQRAGVADRTAGGIYIPDMVADSERPNNGKVIAVGPGHRDRKGRLRPLDVQMGDTVMFQKFAGSEITIEGQEFLILREDEIIAVLKS